MFILFPPCYIQDKSSALHCSFYYSIFYEPVFYFLGVPSCWSCICRVSKYVFFTLIAALNSPFKLETFLKIFLYVSLNMIALFFHVFSSLMIKNPEDKVIRKEKFLSNFRELWATVPSVCKRFNKVS